MCIRSSARHGVISGREALLAAGRPRVKANKKSVVEAAVNSMAGGWGYREQAPLAIAPNPCRLHRHQPSQGVCLEIGVLACNGMTDHTNASVRWMLIKGRPAISHVVTASLHPLYTAPCATLKSAAPLEGSCLVPRFTASR